MRPDVADALSGLVSWVKNEALPLWLGRSLLSGDWVASRLSGHGEPIEGDLIELSAQAQMVYLVSRAEQLGWAPNQRKTVRALIDFAGRHGTMPCRSDGYVRSLHRPSEVADERYDPVDHAWFLLANTACFAAYGDVSDLRRAYNIVDWLDLHFAKDDGWLGVDRSDWGDALVHQLMLRAIVYLAEVTHKPKWRQRADDLYRFIEDKFLSSELGGDKGSEEDFGVSPQVLAKLAWVRILCRHYALTGDGLANAVRCHLSSLSGDPVAPRPATSCTSLAESIAAGVELLGAGVAAAEDVVVTQIKVLFASHVSRRLPGCFVDKPDSEDALATLSDMVVLFDAAALASQLLPSRRS